jgi:hypothetical protein
LTKTFDQAEAGRFFRLISICGVLGVKTEIWKLQTLYFEFVTKGIGNPELLAHIDNVEKFLNELDAVLWCSFSRLLQEVPTSFSRDLAPVRGSRAVAHFRQQRSSD